jgi:hypothetical protein
MLGNLETEGRAETGGEGSEANEPFADITSGLRISGAEMDGREGQPNKLLEDFCFVGELKDVAVGVPGRDMGCTLRGGGCCGVVLASGATVLSPCRTPSADDLNPSTMVGCRSRGGCLVDPFKDGADWLVVKLACFRLEVETKVNGDVLIGGRIGRVGVVDVEASGDDEEGPKIFAVGPFSAWIGVVDDGRPNGFPGEKAVALGLSTVAEGRSCICSKSAVVVVGGVGAALGSTLGKWIFLGNPDGKLCEAENAEDDGASNPATGAGDVDGIADLAKGDPKADVAVPWSPIFDTTGADVDAPKDENEELVSADWAPIVPEVAGGAEDVPKAEEALPNAEPPQFPKTFGVILRFANAEAAGGTDFAAEGIADSDARLEFPKAEAGGIPKAEVDELVPTMAECEG